MCFFCGGVCLSSSGTLNYLHYLTILCNYLLILKTGEGEKTGRKKVHKQEVFSLGCFGHKVKTLQQSERKKCVFLMQIVK